MLLFGGTEKTTEARGSLVGLPRKGRVKCDCLCFSRAASLHIRSSSTTLGFPGASGEEPPASAGDAGSIPGSGRSPGGRHGNPLQYSCLENPTDRGAWWVCGSQRVGGDSGDLACTPAASITAGSVCRAIFGGIFRMFQRTVHQKQEPGGDFRVQLFISPGYWEEIHFS